MPDVMVKDEYKLAELGYRQDLKRDWSMLHNFGVSFSIIVRSMPPEQVNEILTIPPECYYRSHHVLHHMPLPMVPPR